MDYKKLSFEEYIKIMDEKGFVETAGRFGASHSEWVIIKGLEANYKATNQLINAIKQFDESSSKISYKMNKMTRWIMILTIIYTIATIAMLLKMFI